MRKPRVFCWVRGSDLKSGGARCARGPYTHALRARSALRAVRLPLVESGLIVRMVGTSNRDGKCIHEISTQRIGNNLFPVEFLLG